MWNKLRNIDRRKAEHLKQTDIKVAMEPLFMRLHKCTRPLALAALQNNRDDLFWTILTDSSFHLNYVHLRDSLSDSRMEVNYNVFIQYIKYCTKVKFQQRPMEAYDALSQLFEYFRKHFVLVNSGVFN